jgi:Leucine Rich repeat
MTALAEGCRLLEKLDFNGEQDEDDDDDGEAFEEDIGFDAILDKCQNMKELCISSINREFLKFTALDVNPPILRLQDIELECLPDLIESAVIGLISRCPDLMRLCVWGRSRVTDATLLALGEHCPKLQHVNLSHCGTITDKGLDSLISGCHKLEQLFLAGLLQVTDVGLSAIARLTNLKALDLSKNCNITSGAIISLAVNCRWLEDINLNGCTNVTDETVQRIAPNVPGLLELKLARCHGLTDASLYAIAEHCPLIKGLSIQFNEITSSGLIRLSEGCTKLQNLNARNCKQSDLGGLEVLLSRCPSMRYFVYTGYPGVKNALQGDFPRIAFFDNSELTSDDGRGDGNHDDQEGEDDEEEGDDAIYDGDDDYAAVENE